MGLFSKLVRTAVNVATLPVAVAKDVVTLGGVATYSGSGPVKSYTERKLEQIKEEAEEE